MKRVCLWLVALGILSFFLPVAADPYAMPKFAVMMLGALPLLLMRSNSESNLEMDLLLWLGVVTTCAVFSHDWPCSLVGSYLQPYDGIMPTACYLAVLITAARSGETLTNATAILVKASLPMSFYAIAQRIMLQRDPFIPSQITLPGVTRVVSTQGSPLFLGGCLAMVIVCSIYLLKTEHRRTAILSLALALPALWFTQTRGAMLAAAVGAAMLLKGRWRYAAALGLIAAAAAPRLYTSVSDLARIEVWKIAWRVFLDFPIFGYGPGNFYLAFRKYVGPGFVSAIGNPMQAQMHAHMDILHVAATMGLVGLAAYSFLGFRALSEAKKEKTGLLMSVLAVYFVLSKFNPVSHTTFALMAFLFGAGASKSIPAFPRAWGYGVMAAFVAVLGARLTLADHFVYRAYMAQDPDVLYKRAENLNYAARYNQYQMQFVARQIDAFCDVSMAADAAGKKNFMAVNLKLAKQAAADHPYDSYAYEVLGKSELLAGFYGLPASKEQAMAYFDRGQELAPTFRPLMFRRKSLAMLMGQASKARAVAKDLSDLQAMAARN